MIKYYAIVRRWFYLLYAGFFRGEVAFTQWDAKTGKVCRIAAAKGSLFDWSLKVTKVFWEDVPGETIRSYSEVSAQKS